jgi:hypothetical protein
MSTTNLSLRRGLAAAFAVALLGSLVACGDGSGDADDTTLPVAAGASSATPDEDADADLDPEDAMLKYAQCMREHGVDMPDPEPGGGISINGEGLSPEQMEAAQTACQKWMDMAEPADGGRELTEEEKQSFLEMAACMRERGYNFPDPVFDGGRVTQKIEGKPGSAPGPGPDDPAFRKDMEECSAEAGLEPPGSQGDGPDTDEQQG